MSKYYLLKGIVEKSTDKALKVITGCNNSVIAKNLRYFYTFIPKSIIKEIDNNIYIPAWFVMQESNIKNEIDFSNSIEIDEEKKTRKPRKSKEEKQQEEYINKLNSHFNNEIPEEYIEYWYDEDDMRFANMSKLNMIMNKLDKYTKVTIIRNGISEVIK